ncbi:EamA family transporter [Umezawaea beigongshangensis]|uniref:EamA family transporter n=1 Tax=Umezawaea beigongshangensis TaxID=2780383 RepID=UPI0027DE56A4|nr:EamA family transporter [Umezawaea beigongshangensis]
MIPVRTRSAGAVALVIGAAVSTQAGAAVAALLFPRAGALGVVTLRLVVSALVLLAVCRPALRGRERSDWALAGVFGLALAGMNTLFYQAIERIPLGAAVTLEVLGPLTLSVVAARRASSWLWAALALAGVFLLGRGGFDSLDAAGVGFALAAGALWAAYIVLSTRAGDRFAGAEGLALAMTAAAALSLPLGLLSAGPALLDPVTLGLGAVVALMSSALPYSLDLYALRSIPSSVFAVLKSLDPAIAALAGLVVLHQAMGPLEVVAIVLVVAAGAGAVRTGRPGPAAPAEPERDQARTGTAS